MEMLGINVVWTLEWVVAGAALHMAVAQLFQRRGPDRGLAHGVAILAGATGLYLLVNPVVSAGAPGPAEVAMVVRILASSAIWTAGAWVITRVLGASLPRWYLGLIAAQFAVRLGLFLTGSYVTAFVPGVGPTYGPAFPWLTAGLVATVILGAIVSDPVVRRPVHARILWLGLALAGLPLVLTVVIPELRDLLMALPTLPVLWWASHAVRTQHEASVLQRVEAQAESARLAMALAVADAELTAAHTLGSSLVDAASHEMRTPLTAILGGVEILRTMPDDGDQQAVLLDLVGRNARRMHDLVEHLLAAQAREGIQRPPQPEASTFARAVAVATNLHADQDVEVSGDLDAQVWADPLDLAFIVSALASNAERHGGDRLRVTVRADADNVEVEVADDGFGIPPGMEEAVFAAFRQGGVGSQRATGGLGLGLWVSRDRARRNGGFLRHDRAEGWTRFTLTLPRHHG